MIFQYQEIGCGQVSVQRFRRQAGQGTLSNGLNQEHDAIRQQSEGNGFVHNDLSVCFCCLSQEFSVLAPALRCPSSLKQIDEHHHHGNHQQDMN